MIGFGRSACECILMTDLVRDRRFLIPTGVGLVIAAVLAVVWLTASLHARQPPSIFDDPVDDVAAYLAGPHFNNLPVEERMAYIKEMLQRFAGMDQSDSAMLSGFLAGLSAPARDQLRDNARVLAKDVLADAAEQYLALDDDDARAEFLDQWLVDWVRMADDITGRDRGRTDVEILERMRRNARRDNERGIERRGSQVSPLQARRMLEFWQREIEPVASPTEQAQIFHFLPAVRDHLLDDDD